MHIELETVGRSQDDLWLTVVARATDVQPGARLSYLAAAPAERRASFTGSCLPFANEQQAFARTPTRGALSVDDDGRFSLRFRVPGSYYSDLGTTLVAPTLYVRGADDGEVGSVIVGASVPFRTLTYPDDRRGPEFYAARYAAPPRSQADILFANRYPYRRGA